MSEYYIDEVIKLLMSSRPSKKKKEDLYGEDPLDDEMDKEYDGDLIDDEIDEVDEMPETRPSSRASMYNAKIAISIDKDDELAILKNVYGSTKKLTSNESVKLISKIISTLVTNEKETLKLFLPSIESETEEEIKKLLERWGISYIKDEEKPEDDFDDVPF